tara:strand:+ start:1374 stop:1898 length:525 start_codon:yes stop_codon:yes gene_type:complete
METDMKLELKNIKHTEWASEETHCYQASLYVDGKPVAIVSNEGRGGADRDYDHPKFKGDYRATMKSVHDYFDALPNSPFSYEGADGSMIHDSLPQQLEFWCCDQVNYWLSARELKKKLKSHVLVQFKYKDGIYQSKFHPTSTNGEWVINKKAGETRRILNDMPFEEALAIWKAA